jgi:23S rRNA pseudouridine955/2504/2580 synthase
MLSQKAGEDDYSVNDWLRDYLLESGQMTESDLLDFHPAVCNSLDRNTSGLTLAGKTVRGLQEWSQLLKDRGLRKYYRCMTAGSFSEPVCRVDGWLKKDEKTNRVRISEKEIPGGQQIETEYRVVGSGGSVTDLEVHLITGRSHQIRAHLASLGHPILGDPKYGDPEINRYWKQQAGITSQMLHACRVELPDGRSFQAPLPEEFRKVRRICPFM